MMNTKAKELLDRLNPQQAESVEHFTGPLLILAGAGTGKTRVITYRIAYLISALGVKPWNILALTFTNKAAEEMKARAVLLAGEHAEGVTISTFHSFCNLILRREIEQLGDYKSSFTIYDEDDSRSCIKKILKQLKLPASAQFAPGRIKHFISSSKNFGNSPEEFVGINDPLSDHLAKIVERYENNLMHNNALDFDDLLLKTNEIFETFPDVREKYRRRFGFILVDEYQDTNRPQYEILKHLAMPDGNITVVGDLDQSIYGWRGADVGNMLSYEEDFNNVKVVTLEQNYRSRQSILDAANALIVNNMSSQEKKLWSELGAGDKVRLNSPWDEREEAQFVALEIDSLLDEGYQLKDMAVMFRTKAQTRVFEDTFRRMGVPYQLIGATGFYQRKEIKDLIAYLRVIENPQDLGSYARIANVPKRGVGPKTIEKIEALARAEGDVLRLIGDDGKPHPQLPAKAAGLLKTLRKLRAASASEGISALISKLMQETGFEKHLRELAQKEGTESRLENALELKSLAVEYEKEAAHIDLSGFLSRVTLTSDTDVDEFTEGQVKLITLHSAKGLEFPVVFIAGVEEGLLPHKTSIEENEEVEEERRLMYVGITRARELLYLTSCRSRLLFGRVTHNAPSRFIGEIGPEHFEEISGARASGGGESFFDNDEDIPVSGGFVSQDVPLRHRHETISPASGYYPGQRVVHPEFGEGCVVSTRGIEVLVAFPGKGVKTFDARYVPFSCP